MPKVFTTCLVPLVCCLLFFNWTITPSLGRNWDFEHEESTIIVDNDIIYRSDRFYTNGLFYEYGSFKSDRDLGFQLGHEIYTPGNFLEEVPSQKTGERPYAGLLFLGFWYEFPKLHGFLDLKIGGQLFYLGKNAGAGAIQSEQHRLYRALHPENAPLPPVGWEFQQERGLGLQTNWDLSLSQFGNLHVKPGAFVKIGGLYREYGFYLEGKEPEFKINNVSVYFIFRFSYNFIQFNGLLQKKSDEDPFVDAFNYDIFGDYQQNKDHGLEEKDIEKVVYKNYFGIGTHILMEMGY